MSLFCYALLCVHSIFAIILKRKRKLVALLLLSYRCIGTINVLWLFPVVPWVGLQCVIVVFPDHTYFLFVYPTYSIIVDIEGQVIVSGSLMSIFIQKRRNYIDAAISIYHLVAKSDAMHDIFSYSIPLSLLY